MADNYDILADLDARLARKQATASGEFGKGIASGVDALQGSLYGLAGVVGDVVAEPGLRDWGIAGYLRNQDEVQQNPALVQRVEDVGSLKDAGLYAAQGLGQLVPFAASSIAGGGIGGAAARVAGRSAAEGIVKGGIAQGLERAAAERAGQAAAREMTERGIQAGLAGTSIGTEQGSIYGDIYEKTGQYAPGTALAYGAAAGALDVVPELGLLSKAMRPSKGLLRAAGQQAATEAATEAGQTAVERLAVQSVDPSQEAFNADGRSELLNAAILGGIGGGILGGGVDAAGRIAQRAQQGPVSPAAQPATPEPAGPISRSAGLLPGPAPLAALPAPESVLYGDSSGTIRDTGPVRDVDREQRPVPGREQAQPRSPFGGGGIDQPVPRGVVPLSGELIQATPPAVRETPPMAVRTFDASPIYPGLPDLRPEAVVVDPSGQASFARVPTPRPVEDQGPSFGAGMDRQAQPAQRPVFSEVLQQARQAQGALDAKALAERTGASRAMATRALAGAKAEQQVTATAYKSVPGANKALRSLPLPDEFEVVKTGNRQWAVQRRPVQERAYVDSGTGPVDERAAGDQGAAPLQPTDQAGVPDAEATPQAAAVQPVESGTGVPPAAAGADGQRALTVAKPPAQPEPVAPPQPADGASPRANDREQGAEVEQPSATPDRQQVQEAEAPAQAESQGAASQAEAGAAVGTDRKSKPADDAGGGRGRNDAPSEKPARIEDFGEKLGGARKDLWKGFRESISADVDVGAEPLSKSFPEPDYESLSSEGVDPKVLALIAAMRAEIPAKPRIGHRVRIWSDKVRVLRDFAKQLLEGELSADQVLGQMRGRSALGELADTVPVLARLPASLLKSASKWRITSGSYTVFAGERLERPTTIYVLEDPAQRLVTGIRGGTAEAITDAAVKHLTKVLGDQPAGAGRVSKIEVYQDRMSKQYMLGYKGAGGVVRLKTNFATSRDARNYLKDNRDELEQKLAELRAAPVVRRERNEDRVGPARHEGDVSPDQFLSTFGFRGVEFGNWVEGSRRQRDLNNAYDALMDMADVLGIPPQAVSLNGELGLAFGARGKGGSDPASAHYERGKVVINLTKKNGPGSLAHEWLHALDHHFGKRDAQSGFMSERRRREKEFNPITRKMEDVQYPVRDEVFKAFKAIERAVNAGDFKARAVELDQARSKPYWSTTVELAARAFEKYVDARLRDTEQSNDYLVNISKSSVAYPNDEELQSGGIREAFDQLFQTLEVRQTEKGQQLYSRASYRQTPSRQAKGVRAESLSRTLAGMAASWKNAPQIHVVQSIDELPPRLRQQVKRDGALDVEGLYDAQGVYLIADNLSSLQHAAFVLQHEVIGHAGLQGAFGKRLNPLLLSIYKEHPALRSSADRLRDRYGYDKALAMEEVLADLAAAGRLTEQRFWPQLVAAVRNALRAIGFRMRWTDQDIAALLGTARRFIEKGGDKGTGGLVQTYSREPGTGLPAALEKEIDEVFRGKTLTKPLVLGGTPDVLQALGAADAPINITEDTLWKAVDKHSLTPRDVKAALAALGEPVMVFDSATAPDGLVALVETASRGRSVVVAVHMNRKENITVNRIASIHAKDSAGFVQQWMENGLLRYVDNKKADAWSSARGLQLPKAAPKHRLGKKVLRPEDIGKAAGDVRYSRASQRAADFFDQVTNRGAVRFPEHATTAQRDALGKIGAFIRQEPLAKTARALSERWKEKVIQGVFDQFAPIAKLDQAAYMQARLSKGTDGALEATFFHGRPTITDGALDVEADGQGLRGVLAELKGEHDLFFAWIAGNRAEKLAQEGRENLFTPDDIAALRSLNQGTMDDGRSRAVVYRDVLKQFNTYQKAVMDVAEQAGLIDGSSRKLWESEFYVPFYRVMEEGDGTAGPGQIGGLTGQKAFKKLKGGKEPLGDLMANTLANWSHLLSASMKNMAANKALEAAEKMKIATRVREAEKGSLRVMVNGKERHYLVDDPLVLDALTMLNHQDWNNPAMKAMRSFKHALTVGVTSSPAFRARNLLRDSISSIAANDLGYNPLKNMAAGWKGTGKDSPTLHRLLAGGGAVRFGSLNDGDQATYAKRLISRGVDSSQILNTPAKAAKALRSAWDKYQEIGDRLETVNRAALYEKLRAEGKSHLEASYAARDAMDFTSAGKWASVRFLTQIVPFMNARLQGMYKLGRGASADPRRFLAVAGAVAMASTLLFLLNKDDEEFKQLPDWVRDTYWWVRIPGTEKALYLPKPFEVGVMGSVAERLTELALSGDDYQAGDFASTAGSLLWNQLSMSPVPQAFKPLMEAAFNYDSFRDRPIDSMGQERLPAEERYTARTSASAVAAGQLTGISPQRIEHLVRGYFGWLGTQALNTADYLTRGITDLPSNPKSDLTNPDNWTLFGDFVKAADPGSGSKYLTRFYEMQHQIDQLYASASEARKVGDLERLQQLAGNEMLKLRPVYQAANRQITAINQRIKAVTNDRSLGAAEKAELLKQLNATRNQAAQLADTRGRAMGV